MPFGTGLGPYSFGTMPPGRSILLWNYMPHGRALRLWNHVFDMVQVSPFAASHLFHSFIWISDGADVVIVQYVIVLELDTTCLYNQLLAV